jgi:hypothetical protein
MHGSQIAFAPPGTVAAAVSSRTSPKIKLYELDEPTCKLLVGSAPLVAGWADAECKAKVQGGMEKWAKQNVAREAGRPSSCEWYHGTWQYLRLLNMVATPPWYSFYRRALGSLLQKKPRARVLISACADYGMLASLHQAANAVGAGPEIVICDICATPLRACEWYAQRYGLAVECICDNLFTTQSLAAGSFDIVVTDEFFTVLAAEDKPLAAARWKELLKPGGAVVTTAMIGKPTTADLRTSYAEKARRLLIANAGLFDEMNEGPARLAERFDKFATFHTRHMMVDEREVRTILSDFYVGFITLTATPGECVNPTYSLQIVATVPHVRPAAG